MSEASLSPEAAAVHVAKDAAGKRSVRYVVASACVLYELLAVPPIEASRATDSP